MQEIKRRRCTVLTCLRLHIAGRWVGGLIQGLQGRTGEGVKPPSTVLGQTGHALQIVGGPCDTHWASQEHREC